MLKIPIPKQLEHLKVDGRGYPIPYIIFMDKEGCPHFKVNDEQIVKFYLHNKICHVCGKPLHNDMWMIGGQLSAFHPRGVFNDGPVHKVCGKFALQVCPYLAHHNAYNNFANIDVDKITEAGVQGVYNPTQTVDKLAFFVFARVSGYTATRTGLVKTIRPIKPYEAIEFWLHGREITRADAKRILKAKKEESYLPKI